MTQLEKQEIIKLKLAGNSYKQISELTGICISTIKSLCTRYNSKQNEIVEYCRFCGRKLSFTAGKKQKKYCSDKCRMSYWREHQCEMHSIRIVKVECSVCHKEFNAYETKKRKYCCWDCYLDARQRMVTDDEQ